MKLMRRAIAFPVALSAAAAALIVTAGTSASANDCAVQFYGTTSADGHTKHVYVSYGDVQFGYGCVDRAAVDVQAFDTYYIVTMSDDHCDDIGPYWHAWAVAGGQFKYGAGGCGNSPTYRVYMPHL